MTPLLDSTDLRWLAGLARALIRDAHAADDLVQETVVAALEGGLPVGEARRPWLRSVARRLAARRFRTDDRRRRRESQAAQPEALPDTADLVARAEVAEQLAALTRELPEPFRRTLLLRFLEGLAPEEIARREGKPVDTVRYRVRRGLALLREQLERRDGVEGSSWCVLLLPLARSGGDAGLTTAGASGGLAGPVATMTMMKLSMLTIAALCGAGLWFTWPSDGPDPSDGALADGAGLARAPVQTSGDAGAERPADPLPNATRAEGRAPAAETLGSATAAPEPAARVLGRVVDEVGRPVEGAVVYLVLSPDRFDIEAVRRGEQPKPGSLDVVAEGTTDADGAFGLGEDADAWGGANAWPLDLGVSANGFLRQVLPGALEQQPEDGWLVVLTRGQRLTGRVVDRDGRGVSGLALLAHTHAAGLDHVSPTQTLLRAQRAERGDARSSYQQCKGVTDAAGRVTFTGLDGGELRVRSTDPSWRVVEPTRIRAADGDVLWLAERTAAVRLDVVDARTDEPVALARATFRYELTFADGEVLDLGQYVGRGAGGVSFAIDAENTPQIVDRTVTRVVFYGTVAAGVAETTWRSEPLEDQGGARGLAEVRVAIDLETPAEVEEESAKLPPLPQATLELDVLYDDGSPVARSLTIDWEVRTDDGRRREGESGAKPFAPGRYRANLPAGELELSVKEYGASGSLAPWTGEVRLVRGSSARAFVTLERGATAILERPSDWTGNWYVRASWRSNADEDWFGSWNHSSDGETLRLGALRSAEWRFELRREPSMDAPARVIEATLDAGESRELRVP